MWYWYLTVIMSIVASHTWGEDWNATTLSEIAEQLRRLTYVGRGLKSWGYNCQWKNDCVASHTWGEDWNYCKAWRYAKKYPSRLTYVGRGLKFYSFVLAELLICRLTYVGRGLKSCFVQILKTSIAVASHTWGEDWNVKYNSSNFFVFRSPHIRGARIEIWNTVAK